jgi:site-specific recombinase XerD
MTFNFYLHTLKNKSGEKPIYLNIKHQYKKVRIFINITIKPEFWNKKNQTVKNTRAFPQGFEINTQLADIKNKALNVYNRYVTENSTQPELKELKDLIQQKLFGKKENLKTNLISFYENYLTTLDSRLNVNGRPFTKAYKSSVKNTLLKLKNFTNETNKSVDFDKIDFDFNNDFVNYLNSFDYKVNYIGKQIKNLKTVLNEATKHGVNNNLKFKEFKIVEETTSEIYLNEDELKEMLELKLDKDSTLDQTRNLFLFSAWTGLRYSDIKDFNEKADIKKDFFSFKVQKTQQPITIPILPVTKIILKQYQNKLPKVNSVKFNKTLKELGKLIPSLEKEVTIEYTRGGTLRKEKVIKHTLLKAHTGRRSFATNMVNNKMSIQLIMAITGHKKESNFYKYVKLTAGYKAEQFLEEFKNK